MGLEFTTEDGTGISEVFTAEDESSRRKTIVEIRTLVTEGPDNIPKLKWFFHNKKQFLRLRTWNNLKF
jgi:hypothetical protein